MHIAHTPQQQNTQMIGEVISMKTAGVLQAGKYNYMHGRLEDFGTLVLT